MSELTSRLLGSKAARKTSKWPAILATIADRLVACYGTPTLGNFRNPIKEIFYILLSARTTERLYKRAHLELFKKFPRIELLAVAKLSGVHECVRGAGLGKKRAGQVKGIAKILITKLGNNPQRALRAMQPIDAYHFLTRLPGVGPKSALCVMMCSLDQDVFPVDINVQRIFERLGVLARGLKHYEAQKLAPRFVPSGRSKELHVGLLLHGRAICTPLRPKCNRCILIDLCEYGKKRSQETGASRAL